MDTADDGRRGGKSQAKSGDEGNHLHLDYWAYYRAAKIQKLNLE